MNRLFQIFSAGEYVWEFGAEQEDVRRIIKPQEQNDYCRQRTIYLRVVDDLDYVYWKEMFCDFPEHAGEHGTEVGFSPLDPAIREDLEDKAEKQNASQKTDFRQESSNAARADCPAPERQSKGCKKPNKNEESRADSD